MSPVDPYMIIGLAGRAGAGKDTVADMLCNRDQFYRYAFANPLRAEITEAFGIDPECFTTRYKEHRSPIFAIGRCADEAFIRCMTEHGVDIGASRTPREIMRWWGTEYRRAQNADYWTDLALEALHEAFRTGYRRVVITDVRFRNEAQFVRRHGGKIWRVDRPWAQRRTADHQSETEVSQIEPDRVIDNDRSIVALATVVWNAYLEESGTATTLA